jgi:hypothetical protein
MVPKGLVIVTEPPPPEELIVTAPKPFKGLMVTFVPAMMLVTPPGVGVH